MLGHFGNKSTAKRRITDLSLILFVSRQLSTRLSIEQGYLLKKAIY